MAKSIYTTLEEGQFEVNHQGNDITLDLPQLFSEAAKVFDNEPELLKLVQEYEVLLPCLQAGFQARLIQLRAIARPLVKTFGSIEAYDAAVKSLGEVRSLYHLDKVNLKITKSILEDREQAQMRIDTDVWEPVKRPGQAKPVDTNQAISALAKSGMSDEEILAAIKAAMARG